jgi:DNA-binding transcriptional MerR regulator
MPYREKDNESLKLYYSIGEVARLFDVNTSLIRFWEKEFDVIRPKKNKKGNRLFTREDLASFRQIYQLVKEQGFTLEGAKKRLKEQQPLAPLPPTDTTTEILQKMKAFLLDLKQKLPRE